MSRISDGPKFSMEKCRQGEEKVYKPEKSKGLLWTVPRIKLHVIGKNDGIDVYEYENCWFICNFVLDTIGK